MAGRTRARARSSSSSSRVAGPTRGAGESEGRPGRWAKGARAKALGFGEPKRQSASFRRNKALRNTECGAVEKGGEGGGGRGGAWLLDAALSSAGLQRGA